MYDSGIDKLIYLTNFFSIVAIFVNKAVIDNDKRM